MSQSADAAAGRGHVKHRTFPASRASVLSKSEKNNNVYLCLVKDPGEIISPYEWTLSPFWLI